MTKKLTTAQEFARQSNGEFGPIQHSESSVSLAQTNLERTSAQREPADAAFRRESADSPATPVSSHGAQIGEKIRQALPYRGGNHDEVIASNVDAVAEWQPDYEVSEKGRQTIEEIRTVYLDAMYDACDSIGQTRQEVLKNIPGYGFGGPLDTAYEMRLDPDFAKSAHENTYKASAIALQTMHHVAEVDREGTR